MTRVLVVEDSATSAGYFLEILKLEGFDARHRKRDFAGLLNPNDPDWQDVDVLLCDLMVPDATGTDIIATATQHHPHIRCVLFTAAAKDTALRAGAQAAIVLLKPASHDEIIRAVTGEEGGSFILPIR